MSNLTDALIAAKLVGGSGGSGGGSGLPDASGQADNTALSVQSGAWAINGKVLPKIGTGYDAIVPSATYSFTKSGGAYMSLFAFTPTDGKEYVITWDGTDYTCTASFVSGGRYMLGNQGLMGGPNTGEPFIITNAMGQQVIATAETAASHVIAVSGLAQSPADGSVMMVNSGEWQPVLIDNYLPKAAQVNTSNGPTIAADSLKTQATTVTSVSGLPDGWASAYCTGGVVILNGTNTGIVVMYANYLPSTSQIIVILYNPTANEIDLSGGFSLQGVFAKG